MKSIEDNLRRTLDAMAAEFRAAGDAGYFLGILAVVVVGTFADGDHMPTQQGIMVGFALGHLACTLLAAARMRGVRMTA